MATSTAGFTYPTPGPSLGADLTSIEIHQFLRSPALIRRAMRDITAERFISSFLLGENFNATGGGIFYETGEEIYPVDGPEIVTPGTEYRRTTMTAGALAAAHTVKWGEQARVTDEAVTRYNFSPVQKALRKLANAMIRQIDSTALSVVASQVTREFESDPWTEAEAIIESVINVAAEAEEALNLLGDYDFNTVVLKPTQFAKVVGKLITSGFLPRESQNYVLTGGVIPDYLGMAWVTSKHVPFSDPFLVDRTQLGGMANERIESPEFAAVDNGIEASSERAKGIDASDIRVRRVTVPVVTDPNAGIVITGTGV